MSNAANLGFAFRSPLVPPNAFMLVENLHQRKSVEASCAPQPVQVCRLLLVARKVRFFFWLRKRLLLLLVYAAELGWFRLALSKVADLADRPNGAEGSCLLVSFFLFFQIGSNTRGLVCECFDVHLPPLPARGSSLGSRWYWCHFRGASSSTFSRVLRICTRGAPPSLGVEIG